MTPAGREQAPQDAPSGVHRLRALFLRAWPLALGVVLLLALLTPVLAPAQGTDRAGPGATGSALALSAEELGYEVASTAITPASASSWDPQRTALFLVAPEVPYSQAEARALGTWVRDGGRLVVADGTGATRALFERLDVRVRTLQVFHAGVDSQDPTQVPTRATIDQDEHPITLTAPLVVEGEPAQAPWTAFATTDETSFVDLDGDRQLDASDTRGPFVVGVHLLEQRVWLLTSATALTDAGLAGQGETALLEAVLQRVLPDGGTLVVDTSHAARPGPAQATVQAARAPLATVAAGPWQVIAPLILALLAAAVLWPLARGGELAAEPTDPERVLHDPDASFDRTRLAEQLERVDRATRRRYEGGWQARQREVQDALTSLDDG